MKNPVRTEGEAFGFLLSVLAVFGVVALAGALAGAGAALWAFLAALVGVGAGIYLAREPKVREPAVWERSSDPGDSP